MEAKALKTSFLNLKSTHEPVSEDVWVENVIPGDDFFVDDLLDFSKEEIFQGEEEEQEEKDFVSGSSHHNDNCDGFSVKDDFSVPGSELSVPADDLEQLEWLSHFVEDSFSLPYPEGNPLGKTEYPKPKPKQQTETLSATETGLKKPELLTTPFPAKARSKRSRTGVRVWPLGASTETSTSISSSSSASSGSYTSTSSCLIFSNTTPNLDFHYYLDKPPAKKQKKKKTMVEKNGSGAQTQRRCSHCGVQKTPQWRQGPQGAKTLCNACGVRFKSGRLLPEYRPASSPTFSSEVHSNNHRKVMEMRRKKEMGPPGSGFGSPVQSF